MATLSRFRLNAQEREVAKGLIRGDSSEELCRKLHIPESRLRVQIKHLHRKTGTRRRSELVNQMVDVRLE